MFKVTYVLSKYIGWGSHTLLSNLILAFQKKEDFSDLPHLSTEQVSKAKEKIYGIFLKELRGLSSGKCPFWLQQKGMPLSLRTERAEMKMMRMVLLYAQLPITVRHYFLALSHSFLSCLHQSQTFQEA